MQLTLTKSALILIGWLALFSATLPDASPDVRAQNRASNPPVSMDARKRWDSLSQEEQSRLRKRFERLQQLDESEREDLHRRAKKLKREEEHVLKHLSPENQKRLKLQSPKKRRELIAEMVEAERRNRGARIESKLPKKTREWLRNSPPKERRTRLELFKQTTRVHMSARAVEDLGRALGYGSAEIKRLERLPLDERMKTVMNLRRMLDGKQLVEGGLPRDFTPERWRALEALPPEEYFPEILRLKHEDGLRHFPRQNGEGRADRRGAPTRQLDLTRALRRHLHTSPSEFVELSTMPPEERKQEISLRRRRRVIETVREFEVLNEEQLKAFMALGDDEFFSRARAIANGWGKPKRGAKKTAKKSSDE